MDYFLEEKDKDGNFDYRARSSVAWDYEGCMYYLKPFREKFAEDRWNTYYKMLNCSGKKQPAKIQTEMSVP